MDPALIRRAQTGDVEAFTALVAGRFEPMQRTAMAILGHEADARDAVADALAAVWRELPSLRDPLPSRPGRRGSSSMRAGAACAGAAARAFGSWQIVGRFDPIPDAPATTIPVPGSDGSGDTPCLPAGQECGG